MSDTGLGYAVAGQPALMEVGPLPSAYVPFGIPQAHPFGASLASLFGVSQPGASLASLFGAGQPAAPGQAALGAGLGLGIAAILGGGLMLAMLGIGRRKDFYDDMKTKDMVALMAAELLSGPEYQKKLVEAADAETADKIVKSAVAIAERIVDAAVEFETDDLQKKRADIEKKLREATEELDSLSRDLTAALKAKADSAKGALKDALETLAGKKPSPAPAPQQPQPPSS